MSVELPDICFIVSIALVTSCEKIFFKVAKKFASLDFRMTPRKAKGGENRI